MTFAELALELCRAQLARASVAGMVPRIVNFTPVPLDEAGRAFSCRAVFDFGPDHITQFVLDNPADLSDGDWRQRFDAAVFSDECRWVQ